jgi:hypothetical protein
MIAQPALVRRQFFELRCYSLDMTPGMATVTQSYLADALIPALSRIGIGPVGAFRLDYGPETPAIYVLIPAFSAEELVGLTQRLAQDPAYGKAAAAFDALTTGRPAFHRIQSSLLRAFEGFPMLHVPAHGPRIFQMRTYEAPSPAALERKIEMFHHGEFEVFKNAGCEAIFYSETIFGTRMPSLTYMLTFRDLAALTAGWWALNNPPAGAGR